MISIRLHELRNRLGISQYELAKRLGMARTTYAGYESGSREPDIEAMKKISDYYGKSIHWLTTGEDHEEGNMEVSEIELAIKEIVDKYNVDLSVPGQKEKLESIIQLVFGDSKKK